MKRLYSLLLSILLSLAYAATARDFTYTYQGQTLTYTVIDEEAKTCQTKAGTSAINASTAGNTVEGVLTIPATAEDETGKKFSVTTIAPYSFYRCSSLTAVTIADGVTEIGNYAFSNCSSLTSANLPESVTVIGDYAFSSCKTISSISIPKNLSTIGSSAFVSCSSLTSIAIPDAVKEIKSSAFEGCESLSEVIIGENVEYIRNKAFFSCPKLSTVICDVVTPPIIESTSFSAYGDATLQVPAESIESYKSAQYWNGFSIIESLGTQRTEKTEFSQNGFSFVIISDNECQVTGYSENAENLVIPSTSQYNGKEYKVTSIRSNSFSNNHTIKSVKIPDGVTRIGFAAFKNCQNLSSVDMPSSITSIESSAFYRCYALAEVKLPTSLTKIDDYTFFDSGVASITIPSSVTSIGISALCGTDITTINIPNSVTSIGSSAFSACFSLTSVSLPNSLTEISPSLFQTCKVLPSITIPSSVTFTFAGRFRVNISSLNC